MKKNLLLILVLVIIVIACSYIFIPAKIQISSSVESAINVNAAERYLLNESNWKKWWPGPKIFHYNNSDFSINNYEPNSFNIALYSNGDSMKSELKFVQMNQDSTLFTWSCVIESNKNPVKRFIQYFNAFRIKKCFDSLTLYLKKNTEQEENIYGFTVRKTIVTDSVLISTRSNFDHYPTEGEIGQLVQKLKTYIKTEKAEEKNYPMLNIYQLDTSKYDAMVAIATDRLLRNTNDFAPKLVLKGGNILEAEVKGGPYTIKRGMEEFENYKTDKAFVSPAIPYQLMITDRTLEKDTSRWITKFYYPVY